MKQKYTYDEIFQRNIGVFTKKEQEKLRNTSVSIAGLGGVGGILLERLVRLGVENFRVAEPENFEASNLNRQIYSNTENINEKKIDIIVENCKKINPNAEFKIFPSGVNEENVKKFVESDIIIDAIEYNLPYFINLLHVEAKKNKKYVLAGQAIGLGANLFAFSPDGVSFSEYIGLDTKGKSSEEINKFRIPIKKFCPRIPTYATKALAQKIFMRQSYIPSCSLGIMAAASLLEMGIIKLTLGKGKFKCAPDYYEIDFYELLKNE